MASPAPGNRVGPYELLAPIGSGGMGEVWKARDTRLDRVVAIKFSHAQFSDRFEREARAVAALNHSNICTLHDVGPNYLVMEYVEGRPLKGPLPLATAVEYAGQILDALEAAHRKGIVHRDLKPANVIVAKSGIKLLDFGLAKHGRPLEQTDATLTRALTGEGQIVGTLQYMSPEQLQGREADARSDMFSFGCVLYEMLTGKAPFAGSNAASVIAAILERDPGPLDATPPLDRVVRTCLAKDPDRRFQNALDAKRALEWAVEEQAPAAGARRRGWGRLWLPGVAAALVLGAVAAWFAKPEPPPPSVRRSQISIRRLAVDQFNHPVISPDGRSVAYSVGNQIWVQRFDQFEGRPIPGTEGARLLAWSPDSASLAFVLNEQLVKYSIAGGAPVRIASMPGFIGRGASLVWPEPDRIVFSAATTGKPIQEVSASGGELRVLVPLEKGEHDLHYPTPIPGTGAILFVVDEGPEASVRGETIACFSAGKRTKVKQLNGVPVLSLSWSPEGYLLFGTRSNAVWALPFSPSKLAATGEPFLVADSAEYPSASASGTLVFARGLSSAGSRMGWADRSGRVVGGIGEAQSGMMYPALSPDGTRIAYRVVGPPPYAGDIWLRDLRSNATTRLTQSADDERFVSWAPREPRIFYDYAREGDAQSRIASLAADANEGRREIAAGREPFVTPDGKYVLYEQLSSDGIVYAPVDGSGPETRLTAPGVIGMFPRTSPDGRLIAYVSLGARREMVVATFPDLARTWHVAAQAPGFMPIWSRSGSKIYFATANNELFEAPVMTKPQLSVGAARLVFQGNDSGVVLVSGFDAGPNDDRFLVIASDPEKPPEIRITDNWTREFPGAKRR